MSTIIYVYTNFQQNILNQKVTTINQFWEVTGTNPAVCVYRT